jgi:hypothetical protein
MKCLRIILLTFFVLFVASAMAGPMASAVTFLLAEWLAAGTKITTAQSAKLELELEYVNLNAGGFGVTSRVLCSGILDGTVGPNSEGAFTTLLSLSGEGFLGGLACTNDQNCGEPLLFLENTWKTELELMVDGTETFYVNLISSNGFHFECLILGMKMDEVCSAFEIASLTTNELGGRVDQEFSDAFQVLAGLKLLTCRLEEVFGGSETVEINGLGTLLLTSGTALAASSE